MKCIKETLAQVFSCEFCEISKNTFSYRTPPMANSVVFKLNILEDFSRNRKQRGVLNKQTSNYENIHVGVPQRFYLGTTVVLNLYHWFSRKSIFKFKAFCR